MRARSHARRDAPAFRPGWLRFLVSFFAAFLAAGYLAAISHMAFVAHARCAEHGDLVHVDAGAHSPAHAAPERAPSAGEGETASAEEHEHCMLGGARPSEARLPPAACRLLPAVDPPAAEPLITPARLSVALVPPPPPIALLLLSPKSSPPA